MQFLRWGCLHFSIGLCFIFLDGLSQRALSAEAISLQKLKISKDYSASELALLTRLRAAGFKDLPELYIRLFKEERALEVWIKVGARYKLFRNFEICNYSGTLGPKLREGDGQAPEGFYHVPIEDLLWRSAKWPEALNLSFPNIHDAQEGRTGSYLLIHGGCSSKGCFALENGPMSALFALVTLAARGGQKVFPIHIFPFRYSQENSQKHKKNRWIEFWKALEPAYQYFNRNRVLPGLSVCASGYNVLTYRQLERNEQTVQGECITPLPLMSLDQTFVDRLDWVSALKVRYQKAGFKRQISRADPGAGIKVRCNLKRPSCRKWLYLKKKRLKVQ